MTDRREFLQALGGGVLVIGTVQAQEHGGARRREMPQQMGAWLPPPVRTKPSESGTWPEEEPPS